MADFCRQCSIYLFENDHSDFKGMFSWEAWNEGRSMTVICEGCGVTKVDPDGNCCGGCMLNHPRRSPPANSSIVQLKT